jgi:SPP1 family predicted phage head-tail adaptor
MRSGQLRHRVRIEQLDDPQAQSPTGKPIEDWQPLTERNMEVMPQSGREFLTARQTYAKLSHLVRTRYVEGLNPRMRLVLIRGERILTILGVVNVDERSREMLVACEEKV